MTNDVSPRHHGALRGYEWSPAARLYVGDLQRKALQRVGTTAERLSRVDEDLAMEIAKARVQDHDGDIDAALAATKAELTNNDLPTPFEVPVFYNMLLDYSDVIADAAIEVGTPLGFRPMLATIASGHVNAMSAIVPGTSDEYVVMFEAGLFGFLNLVSKVVSTVLLTTARSGDLVEIDLDAPYQITPDVCDKFFNAYSAYIVAGNPMYAKRYMPDRGIVPLHQALLQGAEFFVLGHEFGHVVEGHLSGLRHAARVFPGVSTVTLPQAWTEELAADAIGFELMLGVARKKGWTAELAYAGAEMFFTAIELLEYMLIAIQVGMQWPDVVQAKYDLIVASLRTEFPGVDLGSHPPPAMRRDYLRQIATATPPTDAARRAVLLSKRVADILDALWRETAPLWQSLHDDGIEPAAIWQGNAIA